METLSGETSLIAEEIARGTEGDAWHGPATMEALAGVDNEMAAARPIPSAHTIWEIVLHMTAWAKEVERRLRERSRPLLGEEDWPPVGTASRVAWSVALGDLTDAHARLRQTIREFSPARLSDGVDGVGALSAREQGSFYIMLHGLAQHDAYHTGQIAMLKKALG